MAPTLTASTLRYFDPTSTYRCSIDNIDVLQEYRPDLARPSSDPVLNALCQSGALRLNANRAFVSLIDHEMQYVVAEMTRTHSLLGPGYKQPEDSLCIGVAVLDLLTGICAGTMNAFTSPDNRFHRSTGNIYADNSKYVINDLSLEPLYTDRPYVVGFPHMRYYAEVPIKTDSGYVIGTYAIVDDQPREGLSDQDFLILTETASCIMRHIEVIRCVEEQAQSSRLFDSLNRLSVGNDLGMVNFTHQARGDKPWSIFSERDNKTVNGADRSKAISKEDLKTPRQPVTLRTAAPVSVTAQTATVGNGNDSSGENLSKLSPLIKQASPPHESLPEDKGGDSDMHQDKVRATNAVKPNRRDQEGLSKALFRDAAYQLRIALDLDGVTFLDPIPHSFGSRQNSSQAIPSRASVSLLGKQETTRARQDSLVPPPVLRVSGPDIASNWTSGLSKGDQIPCAELGTSLKKSLRLNSSANSSDKLAIPNDLHRDLLSHYPDGHIFKLDRRVDPSTLEPLSKHASQPEQEGGQLGGEDDLSGHHTEPLRHQVMEARLQSIFPCARSIIFRPLWNPYMNQPLASALAWSNYQMGLFTPDDFKYFFVFARAIAAELARLELVIMDRAKSDFLSSISHELRSPLHGILGGAEQMRDLAPKDLQNLIDIVEDCATTLLDTVNQILQYSKISHQPREAAAPSLREPIGKSTFSTFDLSKLVQKCVENTLAGRDYLLSSRPHVSNNDIALSSSSTQKATKQPAQSSSSTPAVVLNIAHERNWCIESDSTTWRRCVSNILGNALKYTQWGLIEVAMRTKRTNGVTNIELSVCDTGRGISKNFMDTYLFTPFMQEDSIVDGTGLGLSIVKRLVEDLGGYLEISSEVGRGTKATISIPANFATGLTKSQPLLMKTPLPLALGLLNLNDQTKIRDDTSKTWLDLESSLRNVIVTYAHDWLGIAVKTVQITTTHEVDAVVLHCEDLEMATAIMSSQPKVVICTHARNQECPQAGRDNQSQVLTLPFGPKKFANAIESCCQQRRDMSAPTTRDPAPDTSENPILVTPKSIQLRSLPCLSHDANAQPFFRATQSLLVAAEESERRKAHVLLVDDNYVNLHLLQRTVQRSQCTYVSACNGLEAVQAYQTTPSAFTCILMDISMPVMNGFEAAQSIRAYEQQHDYNSTPIIALTGLTDVANREAAYASGMNMILTKPVRMKWIAAVIRWCENGLDPDAGDQLNQLFTT